LVTDIIIFAPVLAIPAGIADLIMHAPHGLQAWLIFAATALFFTIFGGRFACSASRSAFIAGNPSVLSNLSLASSYHLLVRLHDRAREDGQLALGPPPPPYPLGQG